MRVLYILFVVSLRIIPLVLGFFLGHLWNGFNSGMNKARAFDEEE